MMTASTPAPVLVTMFDGDRTADYLRIARVLRKHGINTEVFPDPKPIGKQMKYADKKGFHVALIAGADEFAAGTWQVKGLADGSQQHVAAEQVVAVVGGLLS